MNEKSEDDLNIEYSQTKRSGKLSKKEKFVLYSAIFVFLVSLLGWAISFYLRSTVSVPAYGGEYVEGFLGKPLYINPILAQTNEIDTALSSLIFSSLLKYDNEANITKDLAEDYSISEDGKTYSFKIRQDAKWHDGTPLTAKDVLFTANLIKDSSYKSSLRGNLQNTQVSLDGDYGIKFVLEEPQAPFINVLTFGILPMHIFEEIPADNFLLNDFNLKPIGSGPYAFSDFQTDEDGDIAAYNLIDNENYYGQKPYFEKIVFNFYPDEDALINAYQKKEINAFGITSYEKINQFKEKKDSQIFQISTPRYFGVFFNQTKSIPLSDENVRKALNYATNKKEIIKNVFYGYANETHSPILNIFGDFSSRLEAPVFNKEEAEKILEEANWKKTEDGFRKKDDVLLEINMLTTLWPELDRTAEILKGQWESIGVKVNLTKLNIAELQQNFIRPREYEAILFGQEYFGNDPDPFKFWHSSNKKDPGNNISLFEDGEVDKLLEEARKTTNREERQKKYEEFEKKIASQYPAVFLFSPNYVLIANNKIKGIEITATVNPAFHLNQIENWYKNTKREKK